MKVLCITSIFKNITILKVYEVQNELRFTYAIIDDKGNIIERFKNKSEYYKIMTEKYNIGRTFLELWIKRRDVYTNPKKLEKFIHLTNKRVLYYDEFITENV